MTFGTMVLAFVIGLGVGLIALALVARRLRAERDAAHARASELGEELADHQALAARAQALEALSEVAYNALILVDGKRVVIHMNDAARRLFSSDLEAEGGSPATLIAVTRDHELDDAVSTALREGEDVGLQLTIQGCTYRVRTQRLRAEHETFVALAMEDVSELQRLGRARRDMVANISHELRTPITSIRLLVDTLLRDAKKLGKTRTKQLHKISAETDILQQMAQELLDLSMIESGRAEFIFTPVALNGLCEEVLDRFSEQAERKNLTVTTHIPDDLTVLADAGQLQRVLGNLLHNAIKFTHKDGQVDISAEVQGDRAQICVTDNGPGIMAEERERVFERFYRGDRARRGGGTGLGLAIAKHIVEAHGGRIWAEPAPTLPGARLCFTLSLEQE
jgi:two-component system phosphate regulon sensor histidine kinase PhoR